MTESLFNQIIGNNLRKFRTTETKLRQEDLAKKVGISRSTIAYLESNKIDKGISLYTLYKIAKVLNKRIEDFFV